MGIKQYKNVTIINKTVHSSRVLYKKESRHDIETTFS